MKAKTNRKGFTITELIIVIVVIAILASVLIPAFSGIIEKAHKSADLQLLRNAYTIVETEKALKATVTKEEALSALAESGISSLELSSDDYAIYWDPTNMNFALYDNEKGEVVMPEGAVKTDAWELVDGDWVEPSQPEETQVLYMVLNQQNAPITAYIAKPGYDGVYTTSKVGSISLDSMLPVVKVFTDLPEAAKTAVVSDMDSGAVFYQLEVKDRACTIHSLIPNRTYTVEFKDASGNPVEFVENGVAYSRAQIAASGQVRLIYTETAQNYKNQGIAKGTGLRDIGGWQVAGGGSIKYGMIYRSAKTEILSASDTDKAFLKDALGIQWVFDLRGNIWNDAGVQVEARADGLDMGEGFCHLAGNASARMYHEALLNISGQGYVNKPVYEKIFASVAAGEPILYHCTHGTDRTGTVTFMIQALLGVSDDDLIREFELTKYCQYDAASNVTHEKFQPFIDELNTYDGTTYAEKAYNWFLAAGFSEQELNAFRGNMIENGSAVTYGEVTYALSNVTSSNSSEIVSSKADFITTLTPADGYSASGMTVKVTVGGTDKTAEFYDADTCTVTIPMASITGDVTIEASATQAAGLVTDFSADCFELVGTPPKQGQSYTATLNAKGAWIITKVTVTMGGTTVIDETCAATEKSITVPNVSGTVTVTVKGIENQVSKSLAIDGNSIYGSNGEGYLMNKCLTETSNNGICAKDADGYAVTGWMPIECTESSAIYIKGGSFDETSSTRLYMYTAIKNGAELKVEKEANFFSYFNIDKTSVGDGWIKLTPRADKASFWGEKPYLRISLLCDNGENLIISFAAPN